MFVTVHALKKMMPRANNDRLEILADTINKHGKAHGIINSKSLASFIATLGHESNDLQIMVEITGYYYSKKKKRRIGTGRNAPYAPYYGRGFIQLTHEGNYKAFSLYKYGDTRLVRNPNLMNNDVELACESALWWWKYARNQVIREAIKGDILAVSQIVNMGSKRSSDVIPNGMADRERRFNQALAVMDNFMYIVPTLNNGIRRMSMTAYIDNQFNRMMAQGEHRL